MHRTRTVDYAVVLSGEIDMMLDDSVMHMRAGDVIVQQATNHAWIKSRHAVLPHLVCADRFPATVTAPRACYFT
jgi:uncharacterized cupin superfamily protein